MNVIDPKFQTNRELFKDTRMLLIDHNVCRYHSLDLFSWILNQDAVTNNFDHFSSINPILVPWLDPSIYIGDRILHYLRFAWSADPRSFFRSDTLHPTLEEAENELNDMLADPKSVITPTDLNVRFGPVFERKDFTGYLLRYPKDRNYPAYYNLLTVYEDDHVLNPELECSIIRKHRINAIVLDSVEQALRLTLDLQRQGYKDHITFLIARYGHNYEFRNGQPYYPKMNEILGQYEIKYHHEYCYYDPFTGLTAKQRETFARYIDQEESAAPTEELPDVTNLPGLK